MEVILWGVIGLANLMLFLEFLDSIVSRDYKFSMFYFVCICLQVSMFALLRYVL